MRVVVDKDICVGTANCVDICPEVFELVDAISKVKVGTVPEELEKQVRKAVDECPVSAIEITEE
ncbi:MAG: ferredoxin [Spirochaetota bacterium]|nr:MAG: ferredoxin [Spirochaetota bacterium]